MTLQTVTLSSLEPSRSNPRKRMDKGSIEGLATSIRNDLCAQRPLRRESPEAPPAEDRCAYAKN